MNPIIGFSAAFICLLVWGSYFVPMKKVKSYDPIFFQLVMCISIFISSLLIVLISGSFIFSLFGLVSGLLWASANVLAIKAVEKSGLSKTAPVWMGTVILTTFLVGVLLFKEHLSNLLLGISGLILLIGGIVTISSSEKQTKTSSSQGIILALMAGLVFGSYLIPFKLAGLQSFDFLFSMSLGILIGAVIIYLIKRPAAQKNILIPGALSGILFNIGNIASFFAVQNLGLAIGFPLTQMALFVSILWGIFYFKGIKEKKQIRQILIGALVLFSGAILLSVSK